MHGHKGPKRLQVDFFLLGERIESIIFPLILPDSIFETGGEDMSAGNTNPTPKDKDSTWFSDLFQPNEEYISKTGTSDRTKDEYLPFLVGMLSLSLAFLVSYWDEKTGIGCARDSISHYYYAPIAGPYFVMTLAFVSAFMFAYRGQSRLDGGITTVGSFAALIVAAFPTSGLGCGHGQEFDHRLTQFDYGRQSGDTFETVTPDVHVGAFYTVQDIGDQTYLIGNELSQTIHMCGAVGLIGSLILLSFVHFKRERWVGNYSDKGGRNYRIVGRKERGFTFFSLVLMIFGAILVGLQNTGVGDATSRTIASFVSFIREPLIGKDYSDIARPVYHGELLALFGFGLAWLVQAWNYSGWLNRLPFAKKMTTTLEDTSKRQAPSK